MATEIICIVDTNTSSIEADYNSIYDAIYGELGVTPKCVTSKDLVANNESLTILCKASTGVADITGDGSNVTDSFVTSAECFFKIIVHEDYRHRGFWDDTKYRLIVDNDQYAALYLRQSYSSIIGLQADNSNRTFFTTLDAVIGLSNITFDSCIARDTNPYGNTANHRIGFILRALTNSKVINCVAYGFGSNNNKHSLTCGFLSYESTAVQPFYNCVAYDCYLGFRTTHANKMSVINCVSMNCFTCFSGTFTSSSNNLSSDTSAPGANSLISQVPNKVFLDPDRRIFIPKKDSSLINAGYDASAVFTLDIIGVSRPQGIGWDIGAFEYVELPAYGIVKHGVFPYEYYAPSGETTITRSVNVNQQGGVIDSESMVVDILATDIVNEDITLKPVNEDTGVAWLLAKDETPKSYYYDFSDDPLGAKPGYIAYTGSPWNEMTAIVVEKSGFIGGKALKINTKVAVTDWYGLFFTEVPKGRNFQVTMRWTDIVHGQNSYWSLGLWMQALTTEVTGVYVCTHLFNSLPHILIGIVDSTTHTPWREESNSNNWEYLKAQVVDGVVSLKVWSGALSDEPETWTMTQDISAHELYANVEGYVGLTGFANSSEAYIDWIEIIPLSGAKILMVGDSVTGGSDTTNSGETYRYYLFKHWENKGLLDFIQVAGPKSGVTSSSLEPTIIGGYSEWPLLHSYHAGLGGYSTYQLSLEIEAWVATYQPDVIIYFGAFIDPGSVTESHITAFINNARKSKADVKFLMGLPYYNYFSNSDVDQYRERMTNVCANLNSSNSKIALVDHMPGWDSDLHAYGVIGESDARYPNSDGNKRIAMRWADALIYSLGINVPWFPETGENEQYHVLHFGKELINSDLVCYVPKPIKLKVRVDNDGSVLEDQFSAKINVYKHTKKELKITDVIFNYDSHYTAAPGSDNWTPTWSDDDNQYMHFGDGGGFGGTNEDGRVSFGVARIVGVYNCWTGYNRYGGKTPEYVSSIDGKAHGHPISIGGNIYFWVTPQSSTTGYTSNTLYKSTNKCQTIVATAPETIDSYPTDYYVDSRINLYSGFVIEVGQTFKAGISANLGSVKFYINKAGSPTGNATAYLYEHTGTFGTADGLPTGTPLATSETFDVSTLTTSIQLITFNFTGNNKISLTADTAYVVTVAYSGGNSSNYLMVGRDAVDLLHDGCSVRDLSGWGVNTDRETIFYLYEDGVGTVQFTNASHNIGFMGFINHGKDNADMRDGYVYSYGIKIKTTSSLASLHDEIYLLRVPVADIEDQSAYEWFTGTWCDPSWGAQGSRQAIYTKNSQVGSFPQICYVPQIDRYVMTVEFGGCSSMLRILEAPNPWGPWTQVFADDAWGILDYTAMDYYSLNNFEVGLRLNSGAVIEGGQSFTAYGGGTLTNCAFYIRKDGTPTGNVVCKVYAHSGTFGESSLPTGSALATSDTLDISTLSGVDFALIEFAFSGANQITLTENEKYVVTISYSGGSYSNCLFVGRDDTRLNHSGNAVVYRVAEGWYVNLDRETIFYVNYEQLAVTSISDGNLFQWNICPRWLQKLEGGNVFFVMTFSGLGGNDDAFHSIEGIFVIE